MTAPVMLRDPRRPSLRLRPFKALGHFRKLVADKEDTEQVFHISECLPNRSFVQGAMAFCESPAGVALMVAEPYLPSLLDDHEALVALGPGTVAEAYVNFMRAEGLSAAGLVAESEKAGRIKYGDRLQWFGERLRDTHDMVHVLTGYGRDALGEQCALAFSYGQYDSWTDGFLAWAGGFELWRKVKADAPVFAAIREAQATGRRTPPIYAQSITDLLAEPLEAARARMGIKPPVHYARAHTAYRARGLDPYNFAGGPALA